MSGYSRKLVSLEIALKEIIKDLKDEGLKKATGKSESHLSVAMKMILIIIFTIKTLLQ